MDPAMQLDLGPEWRPLLTSGELLSGGAPVRSEELGLVVFRDAAGAVGVFPEACPHVGTPRASLASGANEDDGLRCKFHGWKFDVNGVCIDIPDVPKTVDFSRYPRAKALDAVERDGMVWVRLP